MQLYWYYFFIYKYAKLYLYVFILKGVMKTNGFLFYSLHIPLLLPFLYSYNNFFLKIMVMTLHIIFLSSMEMVRNGLRPAVNISKTKRTLFSPSIVFMSLERSSPFLKSTLGTKRFKKSWLNMIRKAFFWN